MPVDAKVYEAAQPGQYISNESEVRAQMQNMPVAFTFALAVNLGIVIVVTHEPVVIFNSVTARAWLCLDFRTVKHCTS